VAKLTITRCSVENGQTTEQSGAANVFEVSINPADYKHSFGISYSGSRDDGSQPMGKSNVTPKFSAVNSEKIGFSIVLDGTGVVPDAQGRSVADQLAALKAIVYTYSGSDHEPNVVKLAWGRGLTAFFGRLESMTVDYTLFRATGEALRAKAALSFISFTTQMEEALSAQRSSPDMTHIVRVRAGDTLPLLCQRIYRDASKYIEIARLNGLDGFRALAPDTVLDFPPMR
jgi:nucleoid-associated protein YgaU